MRTGSLPTSERPKCLKVEVVVARKSATEPGTSCFIPEEVRRNSAIRGKGAARGAVSHPPHQVQNMCRTSSYTDLVDRAMGAVILSAAYLENPASPSGILTASMCGAATCPRGNCLTMVVLEESPSRPLLGMVDGQFPEASEPRLGQPSRSPKKKLGKGLMQLGQDLGEEQVRRACIGP